MKKTLIALTLAALPVAASADVIMYGQIKAGVEVSQQKAKLDGVTTKSSTATEIADFGSRIGFKGKEQLADGLNAIWQVENKVSVAGGGEWAGRDSFIGLEGDFGKVRAGKLSTQLKDMDTIDPWEYNNNALGLGVFTRTGERQVSVRYDSPEYAGFSANVQFSPRDNQNSDDKYKHKDATEAQYYAGLNYENAGWFAQYGFGLKKNNYTALKEGKTKDGYAHRVEAGYDANNLFAGVGVQYTSGWDTAASYISTLTNGALTEAQAATVLATNEDNVKNNVVNAAGETNGVKTLEAAATVAYRMGNVTPRLSYAHGWDAKVEGKKVEGTKYDQVVVGADYDFSKRTTAMISAGWLRAGKGDYKVTNTAGLVGLRHKF